MMFDLRKTIEINMINFSDVLNKVTILLQSEDLDINSILELYKLSLHLEKYCHDSSVVLESIINKVSSIKKKIGIYTSKIDDSNFVNLFKQVNYDNKSVFWDFCSYSKSYKNISGDTMSKVFEIENVALTRVLQYKDIVDKFDSILRMEMLNSHYSLQILVDKYMRNTSYTYYIPKSLTSEDKENIVLKYIESHDSSLDNLKLIFEMGTENGFDISIITKLRAKKKYEENLKRFFDAAKGGLQTELLVKIGDFEKTIQVIETPEKIIKEIDSKWIDNNLDFPTLWNNFIYLLDLVDKENRIKSYFRKHTHGLFSDDIFIDKHVKRNYMKNYIFNIVDDFGIVGLEAYCKYLEEKNISIEHMVDWFFRDYLKTEFSIDGFLYNPPTAKTFLEKTRTLCVELDSILKQFNLYCKLGKVDNDILELESEPLVLQNIKSLINNKYIVPFGSECLEIMRLLFSELQLVYVPKRKDLSKYESISSIIKNSYINYNDYEEYQKEMIDYLLEKDILIRDENNNLLFKNYKIIVLLRDLYYNDLASRIFFENVGLEKEINELAQKGYIKFENSLFSNKECEYIDYYLNRHSFNNGHDLRNKYLHGTNPNGKDDTKTHSENYYKILRIFVIAILKINEEFCYIFPKS